jgi:MFS superfamily sulfate permease-like transporter
MSAIATIRVFCEGNPSLGTAVVNGLLAWAGFLGGCTVLCSGAPAAVALLIPSRPDSLARRINQGLGYGFLLGMFLGALLFFVFVARLVS